MSLFVLRDGYRVVATPTGGRLVHSRTGDGLELSAEEVQVLAQASTGRVDARDPQIKPLIKKFANLGVLGSVREPKPTPPPPPSRGRVAQPVVQAPAAEPEKKTSPPPAPHPHDIVPEFRRDLKVVPQATGGLFDVTNQAGKTFTLYDFEVSLARMLDGRRSYGDVVSAGKHIGIPISPNSLWEFIRQLEKYAFLMPPGSPPSDAQARETPRKEWDDSVRTLFQIGLRMYRQGRYVEAAHYFEAMLEQEPGQPEATEMLSQARARLAVGAEDDVPTATEEMVTVLGEEEPALTEPEMRLARPQRAGLVLVVLGLGLIGVGVVAWWNRENQKGDEVGAAVSSAPTKKPEPSPSVELAVEPGDASAEVADASTHALAAVSNDAGVVAPVVASPVVASSDARAVAAASPVDAGALRAQLGADAPAPSASPKAALSESGETLTVKVTRKGRVTMGEVVAPADGSLHWSAAPLKRVKKGEVLGSMAVKDGPTQTLSAPKAGLLMPKTEGQSEVKKGALLAIVAYHEAFMQASVEKKRVETSWRCEVVNEATKERAPCVITVASSAQSSTVTVTAEPLWVDSATSLTLRLAPP